MDYYSKPDQQTDRGTVSLPGIGANLQPRLAFHLIHMPNDDVKRLALQWSMQEKNDKILQRMLHADGSGTLPDLCQQIVIIRRSW